MTTAIIYSPVYLEHRPHGYHPESPRRLEEAMEALRSFGLLDQEHCVIVEPRLATLEDLMLVHDKAYVERVKRLVESGTRYLDGDTYLSPRSFEAALLAAGGVMKACEIVLEGKYINAFALVRPPGHHAGVYGKALGAASQGFCIFNNVAVGVMHLLRRKGLGRVMILDIDCHHGNGTQDIFYESSQVLYVSFHQDPRTLYPGTGYVDEIGVGEGKGYNINIPLPPGSADDAYMKAWAEIVEPVSRSFNPEFVVMSVGYDAHHDDPITMMGLSTQGYVDLFNKALELAASTCNGRFVAALEGGYGMFLAESVAATIASMSGVSLPITSQRTMSKDEVMKRVEGVLMRLKENLKGIWSF
ncbi:MAG: histone deacetylase family protein [Thermoprotei archaeon]|nr:MAG: histone deacetylase family protein [Thermoprotei archaeon]